MTCPTARAAAIKHCLEYVLSPDPSRDNGNNATASEQTIDGATPLIRDPQANSFCPSEDKRCFNPVAVSRGAIQGGGGGFPS